MNKLRIGLDVGGTNTDAVLLNGRELLTSAKIPTHTGDLLFTVTEAVLAVSAGDGLREAGSITLSTTLATNALVENKLERTGVLATAGPGMDPARFEIGEDYHLIPGALDHRGTEIRPLDRAELEGAVSGMAADGIRVFAVAGKFSPRNPDHENTLAEALEEKSDFITSGHLLSGRLDFPRRINTTYYNSAVWRICRSFTDAVRKSLEGSGFAGEIHILKSDGGTMPLEISLNSPVSSILSGPAASVLGALSGSRDGSEDAVVLDIGGTTTDVSFLAGGIPVLERAGMVLEGKPTLIRSIFARPIAVGGDSEIRFENGRLVVGPQRKGPSCAEGGDVPTVTDAFNILGVSPTGDTERSVRGFAGLSGSGGGDVQETARAVILEALKKIGSGIESALKELLDHPVYTIYEMLHPEAIEPKRIYIMGGPAEAFAGELASSMGLEVTVLPHHGVVNAMGAALARPTMAAELFADTEIGVMRISELGIHRQIRRDYSLDDARREGMEELSRRAAEFGYPGDPVVDILESEQFAMMDWGGALR